MVIIFLITLSVIIHFIKQDGYTTSNVSALLILAIITILFLSDPGRKVLLYAFIIGYILMFFMPLFEVIKKYYKPRPKEITNNQKSKLDLAKFDGGDLELTSINKSDEKYNKLFEEDKISIKKEKTFNENYNNLVFQSDNVENLFSSNKPEVIDINNFTFNNALNINYLELYKKNNEIGKAGELLIYEFEKNFLISNNKRNLADKVVHVSLNSDSIGYDILSYDLEGNEKCIEVKTSKDNENSKFFLTMNEIQKIKEVERYFIYRLYNFDIESCSGKLYIIDCKHDLEKYFSIIPTQFSVKPNRKS